MGRYKKVMEKHIVETFKNIETGLKDKNGNKIYSGSIIKCFYNEFTGAVMFGKYSNPFNTGNEIHYGFYVDWGTPFKDTYRKDILFWSDRVEVVGNIYHNTRDIMKIEFECSRCGNKRVYPYI
jgi:uncharacterized phage protein (TIGR01671 family)